MRYPANLRRATAADVASMMDLERTCPAAAHWTESQYRDLFQAGGGSERLVLVIESASLPASQNSAPRAGSALLAFLVARQLAPEWELENMVVVTAARRQGLGQQLLEAWLARARETDSTAVFLEVRESNRAARTLYEKAGFHQTGRRKRYYADPQEDAILYRRTPG